MARSRKQRRNRPAAQQSPRPARPASEDGVSAERGGAGRGGSHEGPLITRKDLAGWIDGPGQFQRGDWPGQNLGLPKDGPTSMPGFGRRFLALMVDWLIVTLISFAAFGSDFNPVWPLVFLVVMDTLLLGVFGTTIGKRIAQIQVVRLGGAPAPMHRMLLRTVLMALVLPPIVTDADGRGLHDRAAGTVQIRM